MRRFEAAKKSGDYDSALERLETEELRLVEDAEGEARRTGADKFRGGVPLPEKYRVRWQRDKADF